MAEKKAKAAKKKAEAKKAVKKPVKTTKAVEKKAEKPKAAEKKAEAKAAEKKPVKNEKAKIAEKKTAKAVEKKAEKPKPAEKKAEAKPAEKKAEAKKKPKKEIVKGKKDKFTKSKQAKKLAVLVKAKKRRMFRGRFGSRSIRKVSNKKWQKWRKPRGIDIYFKKEDGLVPGTGYRTGKKIRFVHPSGYKEELVRNFKELEAIAGKKEEVAARISGKIGKRKKTGLAAKYFSSWAR